MKSTTLRCPNCRKKQEEPYPKRCGCGQSLLTLLEARRSAAKRLQVPPATGREDRLAAGAGVTSGENEW